MPVQKNLELCCIAKNRNELLGKEDLARCPLITPAAIRRVWRRVEADRQLVVSPPGDLLSFGLRNGPGRNQHNKLGCSNFNCLGEQGTRESAAHDRGGDGIDMNDGDERANDKPDGEYAGREQARDRNPDDAGPRHSEPTPSPQTPGA